MAVLKFRATHQYSDSSQKEEMVAWMMWLLLVSIIAVLGIIAYSFQFEPKTAISVASVGVLLAAASGLAGGLLGFLFGIPRTLQNQEAPKAGGTTEILVNTNLEQISDWLTKILVGVGLIQLGKIGAGLGSLALALKPAMGNSPSSSAAAMAIMVTFALLGFLLGWLWTRIFLPGAFRAADVETITEGVIIKQGDADAEALALVNRILAASPGTPRISEAELTNSVKVASPATNVQIFEQARAMRRNSRQTGDLKAMERTIPIFRALIAADTENRFHRHHGQLGYVLKDKERPDWEEAERRFTRAISIRGDVAEQGYPFYELNRAICLIMSDAMFKQQTHSSAAQRKRIVNDLRVAVQLGRARIDEPRQIAEWMLLNEVSEIELTAPSKEAGAGHQSYDMVV